MLKKNQEAPIDELGNDAIFVLTPQAEMEVNLFTWFKINFGIGFRHVGGANLQLNTPEGPKSLISSSDLRSPTASISLLFGNIVKQLNHATC